MKSTDLLVRSALLGALLFASSPALAENPQSETFFAEGRKLRMAGDCASAIVAFRRSFELSPERIGSLRNIAECERELKRYASSRRSYWDLRRAAMKSADPNYQGWDKDAEKAYDEMTSTVSRLTLKVAGKVEGATITIDGLVLDPRLVGVELEEDMGLHTIETAYGGVVPIVEKITLAEGERRTLTIRIPEGASKSSDGKSALFTAGIAGLAVGAAGFIGMGIAAGIRNDTLQKITGECPELQGCPASLAGDLDRGRAATAAANVLGGVGAVGIVAGGSLLLASRLIGGPSAKPAATAPAVSLSITTTPGAAGIRLEGSF